MYSILSENYSALSFSLSLCGTKNQKTFVVESSALNKAM